MIGKVTIKRRTEKQMNGKFGPYTKVDCLAIGSKGEFWFSMMKGGEGIREGQDYTLDFEPREYNGKTYYNAKWPPGETPVGQNPPALQVNITEAMGKKLDAIEATTQKILSLLLKSECLPDMLELPPEIAAADAQDPGPK